MNTLEIRAAVAADPSLLALAQQAKTDEIAEALSVGRTRSTSAEVGNGLVLETLGLTVGNAFLDVIYTADDFRHVRPLLEQGRLVISSPLVQATLLSLVGVVPGFTAEGAQALIALGQEPDPVSEYAVRAALFNDDGSLTV